MIAKGIDINGKELTFNVNEFGSVYCSNNNLTELIIPEGCKYVYCDNNNLTELILPEGCKYVFCDANVNLIYNHDDLKIIRYI